MTQKFAQHWQIHSIQIEFLNYLIPKLIRQTYLKILKKETLLKKSNAEIEIALEKIFVNEEND